MVDLTIVFDTPSGMDSLDAFGASWLLKYLREVPLNGIVLATMEFNDWLQSKERNGTMYSTVQVRRSEV